MDERFRGRGLWIGLGAVALIFLCLLMMAGAAGAVLAPSRAAPVVVQPPAAGEGAVQPPAVYYGPGLLGGLGYGIGVLFKLAFLGLLLLLVLGLVRRLFWGPRHWWAHYCAPVPSGEGWQGQPGGAQPQAHRHWFHRWGPPPWCGCAHEGAAGETGEASAGYSGPQE
jgi:hypothetical protein